MEASETISAANAKVATSSVAAADTSAAAWKSAVGASTKILKYASVLAAVVVYEGVKKFLYLQPAGDPARRQRRPQCQAASGSR